MTHELIEVTSDYAPPPRVFVRGDHPDFVSPVDRTVVHGRKSLREHNARNGVVNHAEFGDAYFDRKRKEREAFYTGTDPRIRRERREDVKRAWEKVYGR